MTTTYEIYTNDGGTPVAVGGTSPAIVGRVENLEKESATKSELAGKEDKGTCLPLTGGELTGSLVVKGMSAGSSSAPIYTTDPSTELMITTGNADFTKGGGSLTLYGRDHKSKGGWVLIARSEDDDTITLQGDPITRNLLWGGQLVDPVVQKNFSGEAGFIKYASGYQLVWGSGLYEGADSQTITLTAPFVDTSYIVVATCVNTYAFWITQFRYTNRFTGFSPHPSEGPIHGLITYVAFGRWK